MPQRLFPYIIIFISRRKHIYVHIDMFVTARHAAYHTSFFENNPKVCLQTKIVQSYQTCKPPNFSPSPQLTDWMNSQEEGQKENISKRKSYNLMPPLTSNQATSQIQ